MMVVSRACLSTDNLEYYLHRGAVEARVHRDIGAAGEP